MSIRMGITKQKCAIKKARFHSLAETNKARSSINLQENVDTYAHM
jgi:hypothetical protein